MTGPGARGGQARVIATTIVVTSLVWIAGLTAWLQWEHAGEAPSDQAKPAKLAGAALPGSDATSAATAEPGELVVPVFGVDRSELTDTFTQSRANGARAHDAIDIMAPRGTPVIAAAAGRIEKLFLSHDGGNTIYVRSPDGRLIYYYAHLDAYAPGLAEGRSIAAGQRLGTVGSTGNADPNGPHLHFAIAEADPAGPWYQQAPALNPYPWLVFGQRPELGVRTQRSADSDPSAFSRRRNERPEREKTTPRSGPEVNSTLSPVSR